jgi:hypothetical protein
MSAESGIVLQFVIKMLPSLRSSLLSAPKKITETAANFSNGPNKKNSSKIFSKSSAFSIHGPQAVTRIGLHTSSTAQLVRPHL